MIETLKAKDNTEEVYEAILGVEVGDKKKR